MEEQRWEGHGGRSMGGRRRSRGGVFRGADGGRRRSKVQKQKGDDRKEQRVLIK